MRRSAGIALPKGKLGVLTVGMGAVATTFMAGIIAPAAPCGGHGLSHCVLRPDEFDDDGRARGHVDLRI